MSTKKISVKVKAGSRVEKVERLEDGSLKVWVKAAPEKGRANEAVVEALGRFLGVPKSRVTIASGHTSSRKIVVISEK